MASDFPTLEDYQWADRMTRIAQRAVHRAQEESRRLGVPNVYSINGILHWELPSGALTTTNLFEGRTPPAKDPLEK